MKNLTEVFLNAFFVIKSEVGDLITDDRALFDKLYNVFLLEKEGKEKLFDAVNSLEVCEVATYNDYARFCRTRQYCEIVGMDNGISNELAEIIAVKGGALYKTKQSQTEEHKAMTVTAVCKQLSERANAGVISSLCALGFLQCEGIYTERNEKVGIANLEKAARWNDLTGIMLSLYYGNSRRWLNISRLYTVTQGTPNENLYNVAACAYNVKEACIIPEYRIMQKAFGEGIMKPDVCMMQHSRFIFSEILDLSDKERILFSGHKEIIAEAAELPLKLRGGKINMKTAGLEQLPITRSVESKAIYASLFNTDMRAEYSFRPLCIATDSEYVGRQYAEAIVGQFESAHVVKINVADLSDYDFEPTKNNVFVRSCNEDKHNIYLLEFRGEIRESILNIVKNFLQSEKRGKFRLQRPGVTIDLSSILPICVSDKKNMASLKKYCDIVSIAPLANEEKGQLIECILCEAAVRYKIESVTADESARKVLHGYPIDTVNEVIDKIARFHRVDGKVVITTEMLREFMDNYGSNVKYGFGGAGNVGI